jgi:ketosteroid isomerase-like protein
MHQNNQELITRFYSSFQSLNYQQMQLAYHDEAEFSDPVFGMLTSSEVKAMWQMLLTRSKDLRIAFDHVHATDGSGQCRWQAWYTFSKTGRPVHNVINSSFEFKDGKIYRQNDSFSLWRWSRQALGPAGLILGWSPWIRNKVKSAARESLDRFIEVGGSGKR